MSTLQRLIAVASVELRFGLRRGWPVIGTGAVLLVVSLGTLYLAYENTRDMPRDRVAQTGASSLAMAWMAFPALALGVLPVATAPAVPADRQLGVSDLLHSTPLTGGIYLLGKVLGTAAAVLLTGLVVLVVHLAVHWIAIGPFDAGLYLELALWGGAPLLLWGSTVGVLAASAARSRKTAVVIGVLAGLLCLWARGLRLEPASDWVLSVHGLWVHWPGTPLAAAGLAGTTFRQAAWSLVFSLLELLGIGLLARLGLWWKENRS